MAGMHWVGLLAAVCAIGCEPVYPEVTETGAGDAGVTDTGAIADTVADTGPKTDVAVEDIAADSLATDVTAAVDIQSDTSASTDTFVDTSPDAGLDTTADASADAVVDAVADATTDAVADVLTDAEDAADAGSDSTDAGDGLTELPISPTNIDVFGIQWTCNDPFWLPTACVAGVETSPPLLPGIHVDLPNPITYADAPPSSGTHRPAWGKWGSYTFLPQQRWLHNLEHGGIAFLYNPCTPSATVTALQALIKAQPADDSGPFRWVLTPYPGLPTALAVVSWGHLYGAACVQPDEIKAFIAAHYRKAPEDEPYPGSYDELWLADWP